MTGTAKTTMFHGVSAVLQAPFERGTSEALVVDDLRGSTSERVEDSANMPAA